MARGTQGRSPGGEGLELDRHAEAVRQMNLAKWWRCSPGQWTATVYPGHDNDVYNEYKGEKSWRSFFEQWVFGHRVVMNKARTMYWGKSTNLLHGLGVVLWVHKVSASKFLSWKIMDMLSGSVCYQATLTKMSCVSIRQTVPCSYFAGFKSTPMILDAPAILAPSMAWSCEKISISVSYNIMSSTYNNILWKILIIEWHLQQGLQLQDQK